MALLPIIEIPDPVLRVQSAPVESVGDDVGKLIQDMFATMYAAPGIGLAAVQVAIPKRLLVIDLQEEEDEEGEPVKDPHVFINPEILHRSDARKSYNEGCLSIPINMPRSNGRMSSAPAGSMKKASRGKGSSAA
jgi:peptide deformylase